MLLRLFDASHSESRVVAVNQSISNQLTNGRTGKVGEGDTQQPGRLVRLVSSTAGEVTKSFELDLRKIVDRERGYSYSRVILGSDAASAGYDFVRTHREALRLAVYIDAASQVPTVDGRYHTIGDGDGDYTQSFALF